MVRAKLTFERILGRGYAIEPVAVPDGRGRGARAAGGEETYFTGELLAQLQGMDEPDHARIEALIAQRRGPLRGALASLTPAGGLFAPGRDGGRSARPGPCPILLGAAPP
jgi:hypothetical protein